MSDIRCSTILESYLTDHRKKQLTDRHLFKWCLNKSVKSFNNRPGKTQGGKIPNELFKGIRTCLLPD
ncbi:hypothetical protein C5471_04415 [Photorhabdus tasmaniensis]|uniref:Transposase n=1 Tax=Photorhabdus tasmaniensis TaxID=1004159 RepID=A0ABX0GD55_9GAMM|nr:hypothetical protein [Photorhabdus tasmaniensis]